MNLIPYYSLKLQLFTEYTHTQPNIYDACSPLHIHFFSLLLCSYCFLSPGLSSTSLPLHSTLVKLLFLIPTSTRTWNLQLTLISSEYPYLKDSHCASFYYKLFIVIISFTSFTSQENHMLFFKDKLFHIYPHKPKDWWHRLCNKTGYTQDCVTRLGNTF